MVAVRSVRLGADVAKRAARRNTVSVLMQELPALRLANAKTAKTAMNKITHTSFHL